MIGNFGFTTRANRRKTREQKGRGKEEEGEEEETL
jgi:hypothetical protein